MNVDKKDEFIDLKVYDYIKNFRKNNAIIYKLLYELIDILRECETQIEKLGTEKNNVYLLAMFMQLNKFFQSSILMFEHGLKDVGESLIRTCLELSIKIIELIKNQDFIEDYELESYFEMRNTTKIMLDKQIYDLVSKETLEKCLEFCNRKIGGKKRPNVKINNLIEKNGLYREYVLYRLHCNYTHQSIDQMNNIISSNKFKVTINGNFQLDKFNDSIAMLISVIMIVLPVLIEDYIKNEELKDIYNVFNKKIENIFLSNKNDL